MSEELKNITENVMNQINQGKAKMKPKIYFVIGSILTFVGLISSIIVSIFFVGLIRFSFRSHGPMGQYKFDQMISNFPWWIAILAILSLIVGIWIIKKYDFSYKKNPLFIVIGFVLMVLAAGWLIDTTGLNDILLHRGPMKGMMRGYLQNITPPP